MIKTDQIEPGKLDLSSHDIVATKRQELLNLFPEVRTEGGKIDFDRLKSILGEMVDAGRERYGMNWPGKAECMRAIQAPSMGTLLPVRDESVDWETTENLIIEGDNLEVLKLLQKSYLGKVKMIFIDPPYNTGNDFIYPDNFSESLQTYLEYTGQVDSVGRRFGSVSDTDGRFHSKWLSMMYPRLFLARSLLSNDGAIFISIGDAEMANLKKLCDEIFGEENLVAHIAWQKKYAVSQDDPGVASMLDHILLYRKSDEFSRRLLPRTEKQTVRYTNLDNDPRGPWSSDNYISKNSREERPTLYYAIKHPKTGAEVWPKESAVWRYSKEKHLQMVEENRLYWGPNLSYERPRLKRFLSEVQAGIVPSNWWPFDEVGHNDEAQKETAELVGPKVFSTPKPVRLVSRMLELTTSGRDIVLDFFAGSGATAHAVMAQNIKDGASRRFVLVQLPEVVDVDTPSGRAGYKTISDITRARVRAAGKKLAVENGQFSLNGQIPDLGFRAFRLAPSNFIPWDGTASNDADQLAKQLQLGIEHIRDDRTPDDLLYEILLKSWGEPALSLKIDQTVIEGVHVFSIAEGTFVICLEETITLEFIRAVADRKPDRVVMRESAFAGNDQLKTNAVQTFKSKGVTSFKVV